MQKLKLDEERSSSADLSERLASNAKSTGVCVTVVGTETPSKSFEHIYSAVLMLYQMVLHNYALLNFRRRVMSSTVVYAFCL